MQAATTSPKPAMGNLPRHALLRLTLLVAIIVAVLLSVLLAAGHRYWRGIARKQIDAHLTSVAEGRRDFVCEWIGRQQDRAHVFATRGVLRNYLEKHVAKINEEPQRTQSQENLDGHVRSGAAVAARIVSREGQVLLSSDKAEIGRDLSADPVFLAGLGAPFVSSLRSENGRILVDVGAPSRWIDGTRGAIGVVMLTLDATPLAEALSHTSGLGTTGEVLLGTRDGGQVHYLLQPRYQKELPDETPLDFPAMAAATEGRQFLGRSRDYRGQRVLVAALPVGYAGWGLVVKLDEAEAYEPITRALRYGLGLGAVIALVGLGASYGLARHGLVATDPQARTMQVLNLGKVVWACELALLLIGLLVLTGWALGIPQLTSLLPAHTTMKVNAALGVLLATAALALRHHCEDGPRSASSRVGWGLVRPSTLRYCLAGVVILLGCLSLAQDFTGADFGLDQLFCSDPASVSLLLQPGRMSVITALNFILLGSALLLLGTQRIASRRLMEALALLAGAVSLLTIIGYVYNAEAFYKLPGFGSTSLPTALAFQLLAVGVLCSRKDGLAGLLASASLGGQVARRFLPLAFIAPVVVGWLALHGMEAGVFDASQEAAIVAALMVFIIGGIVWWNALSLGSSDTRRMQAKLAIRELNEQLEQRVSERTMELSSANESLAAEIVEREQAEEALQMMRFSVDRAGDSIFWVDRQGHLLYVNDAACTGRGYSREELLNMTIFDLDPDYQPGVWDPHFEDLKLLGTITLETRHRRKDGSVFPVEVNANYVHNGGQEFNFAFLRDITDRKQAEDLIRKRTEQLEEANKELEAFSYSVSHDLRAPLRAVTGFINILKADHAPQMDADALRLLDIVSKEASRMGQLIDDLLEFSRMGRQQMVRVDVDMTALVRGEFESLILAAPEAAPRLELHPLPPAKGDPAMLRQVFANLLSNAMKFSRQAATPVIEVGSTSDGHETIYYVKDNGVGFDDKYSNKLFGVFQRLHSQEQFEGTGVGLALAQRVISRHVGRIWAKSQLGQGATFYLTLPISTLSASTPSSTAQPTQPPHTSIRP